MSYTSIPAAVALTGLSGHAIRRLAIGGSIRWTVDERRMMRVCVADLASITRRAS